MGAKTASSCFAYCGVQELVHLGEDVESYQSHFCFPSYKQTICMPQILTNHLIQKQWGSRAGSQSGCLPSGSRSDIMTEVKDTEAKESLHLDFRFMLTL